MKILLFCNTNNVKSGTGAVVNNLIDELGNHQLCVLSEENHSLKHRIESTPIMKTPKFPKKGARFFTWLYLLKFKQAKKKCAKVIQDFEPDVIMTIYPNEYFLLLATQVSKKHNLPLVSWYHNTFVENRSGLDLFFGRYIQKRVFNQSKLILTISEGLTEYYKSNYPQFSAKYDTLQHGFPPQVNTKAQAHHARRTDGAIRFAFTGSLNSSCMEASIRLFEALSQVKEAELHIFSGYPIESFKKIIPISLRVVYHGFVEKDEFLKKLQSCNIALIAHGFKGSLHEVEYQTIFPTRTIPLLQTNVPILLHSPKKASFTDFMRKNECALIVDEPSIDLILEAIFRLKNDEELRSDLLKNANKTAEYFDIEKTAIKLVHQLKRVV